MFKLTGKCKDRALRLPSEHDMWICAGTAGMMLNISKCIHGHRNHRPSYNNSRRTLFFLPHVRLVLNECVHRKIIIKEVLGLGWAGVECKARAVVHVISELQG